MTHDEHKLYTGVRTLFEHGCTEYAMDIEVLAWEAKERPALSFIDKQFFYFWVGCAILLSCLLLVLYNMYPFLFHPLACCFGMAWLVTQCITWTKSKAKNETEESGDSNEEVPGEGGGPSQASNLASPASSLAADSLQPSSDGISSSVHQSDSAADEFSLASNI